MNEGWRDDQLLQQIESIETRGLVLKDGPEDGPSSPPAIKAVERHAKRRAQNRIKNFAPPACKQQHPHDYARLSRRHNLAHERRRHSHHRNDGQARLAGRSLHVTDKHAQV